jgi:hypothetical protein
LLVSSHPVQGKGQKAKKTGRKSAKEDKTKQLPCSAGLRREAKERRKKKEGRAKQKWKNKDLERAEEVLKLMGAPIQSKEESESERVRR